MIRFPPVEAAIEGFRVTREHPLPVLMWTALLIVFNILGQVVIITSGLTPAMEAVQRLGPEAGASAVMAVMQSSGGWFALLFVMSFVVYVMLYTALLRAVLDPSRERAGYLNLGMDEARQLGLALLIFVCALVYSFICQLIVAATFLGSASLSGAAGGLLRAAVVVAIFVAFLYPAVRLSLAPAMTFADRRISLFRSWALTAGQFWGLFGAYVLAVVLAFLVLMLAFVIFAALALSLGMATGGSFDIIASISKPAPITLETLFAPTRVVFLIFNAVCTTLFFVLTGSVAPAAFRLLSGRVGEPTR
ncbi:hypothetical protein BH09PSE2_BH09PSE2_09740 [soil metagenome]